MADLAARPRASTAVAAVCVAVAVFLLLTALGVGDGKRSEAAHSVPAHDLYAFFLPESPHVMSTYSTYSTAGLGADLQPSWPNPRFVLSDTALNPSVARYKKYAVAQLGLMEAQIGRLEQALTANDAASSKSAWRAAYASYLRIGGVYLNGRVEALNEAIDGTPAGLQGGVSNPHFEGLHRIEYGLWTGQPPRTLLRFARRVDTSVHRLRGLLPSVTITTLEYGTRAHEILEGALRDLLSGRDVRWSREGVLATAAGLQATEQIISTLHTYLSDEDSQSDFIAPMLRDELAALRGVLGATASEHGGASRPTSG